VRSVRSFEVARNPVLRYVLKRVTRYVVTLFVAFTLSFLFFRLIPGSPVRAFLQSMRRQYGVYSTERNEIIDEYNRVFGLEGDLFTQYINYMQQLLFHGNLGPSFLNFPTPSQVLIMRALPWTIGLLGLSTIIAWILGNILGSITGWKRGSKLDNIITPIALFVSQIPYYLLAIVLVLVFGYALALLPTKGAFDPAVTGLADYIRSLIIHGTLPALSIVLVGVSGWIISMRSLMVTVLGEDYILYAYAKGLRERKIWSRYALRSVLLPQVTGLGMSLGFIVNGTFLVEYLFTYPGIGRLFVTALAYLDFNTIQGVVLMSIISVLTATLLIDLLYPLVDPRIKSGA